MGRILSDELQRNNLRSTNKEESFSAINYWIEKDNLEELTKSFSILALDTKYEIVRRFSELEDANCFGEIIDIFEQILEPVEGSEEATANRLTKKLLLECAEKITGQKFALDDFTDEKKMHKILNTMKRCHKEYNS